MGLLVGVERGWRDRDLAEGGRVAGLRTFALVGLLGGVLGSLTGDIGASILAAGFVGLSLLLAVSYREAARSTGNLSVTSAVATLLTFKLGVLAARGMPAMALAVAVITAVITAVMLNLKPTLHAWLQSVESREISASLQLLVLWVVILPNLPGVGYGPNQALNPCRLWWTVVLIAGLSLAGHFAMRMTGAQRGIFLMGLLGDWRRRPRRHSRWPGKPAGSLHWPRQRLLVPWPPAA